jgi:hypothetical protein
MPHDKEDAVRMVAIARNRVLWWLHRYPDLPKDAVISGNPLVGEHLYEAGLTQESFQDGVLLEGATLGRSKRSMIGPAYKKQLLDSFLAVTANPAQYEGDHRTWEHLAAGNVVMSDNTYTPIPFPLVSAVHFIEYDNADKPENEERFRKQLRFLLRGGDAVKNLACDGLQHVLRHHRSVNRVDYMLRTIVQKALSETSKEKKYTETGLDMREQMKEVMKFMYKAPNKIPPRVDVPYLHSVMD